MSEDGREVAMRKPISKKSRFEVFKRDGFRCVYCGMPGSGAPLVVDHVTPVVGGGGNDPSNLVTCCEPCNQGKGRRPLGLAERMAHLPAAVRPIRIYRDLTGNLFLPRDMSMASLKAGQAHDLLEHLFDRPRGDGVFRFGGVSVDFKEGVPPRSEWADPVEGIM